MLARAKRVCGALFAGLSLLYAVPALAEAEPLHTAELRMAHRGRPRVHLDRLELPANLRGDRALERYLRRVLRREAARADWGAGAESTIEYRFSVRELSLELRDGVLHVRCTAVGRLPKGKSAHSRIEFGGDPEKRPRLVRRVLEVVARGVIARLSALERARRAARPRGR